MNMCLESKRKLNKRKKSESLRIEWLKTVVWKANGSFTFYVLQTLCICVRLLFLQFCCRTFNDILPLQAHRKNITLVWNAEWRFTLYILQTSYIWTYCFVFLQLTLHFCNFCYARETIRMPLQTLLFNNMPTNTFPLRSRTFVLFSPFFLTDYPSLSELAYDSCLFNVLMTFYFDEGCSEENDNYLACFYDNYDEEDKK